ncbi:MULTISPECIES: hypothetical protein [unclassified Stenotrophomonas]|uniref:hypothetical protein n=1 Tax=unclassified Stenotrophomonas TaxID=196198 RepID=UPI001993AF52|nr:MULTISPECIES: hypothetical protein [unclassified Stenotrophomonas]MBD3827672.1 hypothetical protein [Stenotrophomonas sp.]
MSAIEHCDAAFKEAVLLKCYEALEVEGFTRYRKQEVDWPMENGFHCWVGLNTSLEREYLDINPFVGVHVAPIMKLYTSLKGRKYSRNISTYAVHMGELAPHEQAFRFTRKVDVAAQATRLARLYSDVGLSYALSIGTYERLLPLLQARVPMLGAYPERVACCLYLMGRKEEARLFVEEFLLDHRDYFERFAVPFSRILNGQ